MSIVGAFAVPHPPLIIPEVSPGEEHQIQHTVDAYDEVGRRIAELAPETIVISSPHSVMYYDYLHISPGSYASGSFARLKTACRKSRRRRLRSRIHPQTRPPHRSLPGRGTGSRSSARSTAQSPKMRRAFVRITSAVSPAFMRTY